MFNSITTLHVLFTLVQLLQFNSLRNPMLHIVKKIRSVKAYLGIPFNYLIKLYDCIILRFLSLFRFSNEGFYIFSRIIKSLLKPTQH